jgi:hypothetical protein
MEQSSTSRARGLRTQLVQIALEWEEYLGVGPAITPAISELDAAFLVGMSEEQWCADGKCRPAVPRRNDFTWEGVRYQVSANRPSSKKDSAVTWVSLKQEKKREFVWDRLIWILYDHFYVIQEAWEFEVNDYRDLFTKFKRLSPNNMRSGRCLVAPRFSN